MMRYEVTGVIPMCMKCGTQIPQGMPYYYDNDDGPKCRACREQDLDLKAKAEAFDEVRDRLKFQIMGDIDIALEYVEALEKAVGTERPEKEAE